MLVDDHGLFREGISLLLKAIDPAIEVVYAGTAADALARVSEGAIDLVFLDLELPDRPGMELITELRASASELPLVVLSGHDERDIVLEAIRRGAMGFIPKASDDPKLLWHALRMATSGAVTVPASVMREGAALSASPHGLTQSNRSLNLTARQWDVLRLLIQGLPNKLIARRLDIAETTARGYVSELLAAFGVTNRTQLVVEVARRGVEIAGRTS